MHARGSSLVLLAVLLLAGCGGGGGNGTNDSDPRDLLAGMNGNFETSGGIYHWLVSPESSTDVTSSVVDCRADGFTGHCIRMSGTFFSPGDLPGGGDSLVLRNQTDPAGWNVMLKGGQEYVVAFRARGDQPGMKVACDVVYTTREYIEHQEVLLSQIASEYTVPFSAPKNGPAWLSFRLTYEANNAGSLQFDDIRLLESPQ